MELANFIKINQISDYNILKQILESDPYNLKVKEDINYPSIFLIHTKENSNINLKIVNECNGIILDKDTLKIICYTFDKCSDLNEVPDNFDKKNLYLEYALEGTLIRLYYHNEWILSTKKCLDASKARWMSDKSFKELFYESFDESNFEKLNKTYCYSFLITHPENNIVVKYDTKNIYHLSTRNMITLKEIDFYINNVIKLERRKIDEDKLFQIYNEIMMDTKLLYEGFVFIDSNYNRWKLRTNLFIKVRNLWGNSNDTFFRYLELRKNQILLNEYLMYFSYDKLLFIDYESNIRLFANFIQEIYISRHVKKIIIKVPYYLYNIIYKLHGNYLKNRIITDHNKIMLELLELDAKKLCYMINCYTKENNNKNILMEDGNCNINDDEMDYNMDLDTEIEAPV